MTPRSTATRRYGGQANEPPAWPLIERIFDAFCGADRHDLQSWPTVYGHVSAQWTDATGVQHEAENLAEVEEAYQASKAVGVSFGGGGPDRPQTVFVMTGRSVNAEVRGPPDEVDALMRPVVEAFPLQPTLAFVSWSGDRARRIAEALRAALEPRMPSGGTVFLSSRMAPGLQPLSEISDVLRRTDVHLAVITAESAKSPWVMWEAAASWAREKPVIPIFVDTAVEEIPGPLRLVAQGVPLADVESAVVRALSVVGGRTDDPLSGEEVEAVIRG